MVPFSAVDLSGAVNRLKSRKVPGSDCLMAENLKAGGDVVITWLMKILNAVMDLEVVHEVLKSGVIVPQSIRKLGRIP